MIDWLELLWSAAQEQLEFDLTQQVPGPSFRESAEEREQLEDGRTKEAAAVQRTAEPLMGEPGGQWRGMQRLYAKVSERGRPEAAVRAERGRTVERLRRSAADSALTALYRRVRETVSPGASGVSGRSTVVVREQLPAGPGLTEEGLDRALRRDSRRYDGGMSIY